MIGPKAGRNAVKAATCRGRNVAKTRRTSQPNTPRIVPCTKPNSRSRAEGPTADYDRPTIPARWIRLRDVCPAREDARHDGSWSPPPAVDEHEPTARKCCFMSVWCSILSSTYIDAPRAPSMTAMTYQLIESGYGAF